MTEINIARTLAKFRQGTTKDYDILTSALSNPQLEPAVLISSLMGLRDCITVLTKEFESLVGVLLRVDWVSRDAAVIKEYKSFILNLVSAHTFYLRACLRMIVKQFCPKIEKAPGDEPLHVDAETRAVHEQQFLHIHALLKAIVQIVPMTANSLMPMLSDCFPYMGKDAYFLECYVRNLLQVTQYLPTHRDKILELIVDRMTKLDVRSPRQDIEEAEGDDDDIEKDFLFDMEELNVTADPDDVMRNGHQGATERNEPMCHKDADRLDVMMELMMRFIHNVCHRNGELDWEATKKLYRELLLVFEKIILPTHASCHVQFLMFYICSFREALCEGFLDYLWKRVQNPNTQVVFRQASVAYIASTLARAKYIPVSVVKACLELMVGWVHRYIAQVAYTCSRADVTHHGAFYSTCQAIFYVFAFRHKDLLEMHRGYKFCQSLNLQTIVTCRLNPLRVCLPVVAQTFSTITRTHQLAFCDTILERNRRCMLPVAGAPSAGPSKLTSINPLDSFFPFDPYMLNRSGKFVTPLYGEYEGTPVEEETDQDIQEEEEEEYTTRTPSADTVDMDIADSFKSTTPSTPTDFLMYGISPGFKHM